MNDHAHDDKRDAGSPEDQSRQAAHEAKLAAQQEDKATDAADIAAQELAKRKAISAYEAAKHKAEQEQTTRTPKGSVPPSNSTAHLKSAGICRMS